MKEFEKNTGWKQRIGRAASVLGVIGVGYIGVEAKTPPPACFQKPLPIGHFQWNYRGVARGEPPSPDTIRITQWYYWGHKAVDIRANTGTPVEAAAAGRVVWVLEDFSLDFPTIMDLSRDLEFRTGPFLTPDGRKFETLEEAEKAVESWKKKYEKQRGERIRKYGRELWEPGNAVFIAHSSNSFTGYMHLERVLVEEGERVEAGQLIGFVGNTGKATGPHLHFEININGEFLDPLEMFCKNTNV